MSCMYVIQNLPLRLLSFLIIHLTYPFYYYRVTVTAHHLCNRQCVFIPNDIKEEYSQLKGNSRGGMKQYWVTSAVKKGLTNGEKGITFVTK